MDIEENQIFEHPLEHKIIKEQREKVKANLSEFIEFIENEKIK